MPEIKNLAGRRFGRLVAIEVNGKNHSGVRWLCKCDCGKNTTVNSQNLQHGGTKSCGCFRSEKMSIRPFEYLYNWLVKNSQIQNIPCDLTYEDFLEFTKINKCHYCEREIEWYEHEYSKGRKNRKAYNIDRKNNSLGYIKINCVVCCNICNKAKNTFFTYNEFMMLAPILKKIQEMRFKI